MSRNVRGEAMVYKRGKIMSKGRMYCWMLLVAGAFMLGSTDSVLGQLLYQPEMDQEFYGYTGYNVYGRSLLNRATNPRFDELGNYIMDGVRLYSWEEERKLSRDIEDGEYFSHLYKINTGDNSEYFRRYVNNLVMVGESTKNFSSRFIVGNEIRVLFSPLTLDMAALNGVRWDMRFGESNVTLVSSRADIPMWFVTETSTLADRVSPVILTGGHFERQMGVLNVAANYVNTYKTNGENYRSVGASSLFSDIRDSATGTLSGNLETVKYLVVKVEDDSHVSGDGPRIYDMYPTVSGTAYKDWLVCISEGNWQNDFTDAFEDNSPSENFYENVWMLDPKRVPRYDIFKKQQGASSLQSNYLMYRKSSTATPAVVSFGSYNRSENAGKDYLECDGYDYLLFWFAIPSTVTDASGNTVTVDDVRFRALLGNDYKISISEMYEVKDATYGMYAKYFSMVKQSPGNVRDMSNFGWVDFRYGAETANVLMGLRLSSKVKGFSLVAEFNKNFKYYQYPNTSAEKFSNNANAYYLNLKRDVGNFSFGTELFNIDTDYSTEFENMDLDYKSMSTWNTAKYFVPYTNSNTPQTIALGATPIDYMNWTIATNTVDDNDDKDRYPDFHIYTPVRDMNGIFPGQDENGNGRPDTNENENLVPDYAEPFFLFGVDSDEYSFGDDFNNNGIIDSREDDDQPDYPYDRDTRGYHVFGSWGSEQGVKYTLGVIDYHQMAEDGKTKVKYGKVEYKKFIPFFANVNMATIFKKSQDDIDDNGFRVMTELSSTLHDSLTYAYNVGLHYHGVIAEKYYDPLEYRDSYVSTSYFETKLFRIPNLTIGIKVKYDLNHQNETSYQSENDIVQRGQILRAEYRYYFHDLLIMPQVKFQSMKYTSSTGAQTPYHDQYFYPILRVEYPLTTKTTLKCGMQGLPGVTMNNHTVIPPLNSTVRDLLNDELSYDQRDYVFMITNMSAYNGYDFALNLGYQVNWQNMKSEVKAPLSSSSKMLFLRVVIGMEPIS